MRTLIIFTLTSLFSLFSAVSSAEHCLSKAVKFKSSSEVLNCDMGMNPQLVINRLRNEESRCADAPTPKQFDRCMAVLQEAKRLLKERIQALELKQATRLADELEGVVTPCPYKLAICQSVNWK